MSRSWSLNLTTKVSVQLAVYPGDGRSGYPQHCDVSGACSAGGEYGADVDNAHDPQRILTSIYYLTPPDWSPEEDGGHLRLTVGETNYDAAPLFNRCIVLRSDKVLHQVLPSKRRNRIAVTMWFYGTQLQHKLNDSSSIKASPSSIEAKSTSGPSPLTVQGESDSVSTILVSIASYRDSETLPTIRSLLENAKYPNRITIGLVWQYHPEMDPPTPVDAHPQIRCLTLHAKDARGPCYARRLAQLLYRDENYVLQIDSHMRFRQNWDVYLIEQLPAGKSMLTTYPIGYELPNKIPNEIRPTLLVPWKFDASGMLRQRGRLLKDISSTGPIRTQLYAAGFNFARRESIHDCPYLTHEVFFGEEVYRAVQFHQQNYQLWAPPQTVVYHLWSREHRPTFSVPNEGHDMIVLREHLDHHVPKDVWTAMGVCWKNKEIFEGALLGGMPSETCFAGWADESLARKIASLNVNARDIIGSYLSQLNENTLASEATDS
jgi:[Skp1-protein]-hydroxyproline N-acetylglucosaminyltransferase